MECKFVVGQKVTPVRDMLWGFQSTLGMIMMTHQPVAGEVYVVSGFDDRFAEIGLYLQEFAPVQLPNGQREPGYYYGYFRPVDDLEIEEANEMLKRITDGVKEPV